MNQLSVGELVELPKVDAVKAILETLRKLVGGVLRVDHDHEFPDLQKFSGRQFSSLGIDSFMAMSLLNQLRAWVGIDVPTHMLIGDTRIVDVVEHIYQKVLLLHLSQSSAPSENTPDSNQLRVEEIVV